MSTQRLLLVDDEWHVGTVIQRVAERVGFEVQIVTRAEAFAAAYETFRPDAVTLDLGLPDSDGVELLRFLADAGCAVPILIISGFDDKVLDAARRLGKARGLKMAGCISKPMRIAELQMALDGMRVPT